LAPPVALLPQDTIGPWDEASVTDFGREELRGETQLEVRHRDSVRLRVLEKTCHRSHPDRPKVTDCGLLVRFSVTDIDLNAAWGSNSTVEETNSIKDGREGIELGLETVERQVEPGVPVREISVEPNLRKLFNQSEGSPGILGQRGAMGFYVERYPGFGTRRHYLFKQESGFIIALEASPDHQRATDEAEFGPASSLIDKPSRRGVDAEGGRNQTKFATPSRVGALNSSITRRPRRFQHVVLISLGTGTPKGKSPGRSHVQIETQTRGERSHQRIPRWDSSRAQCMPSPYFDTMLTGMQLCTTEGGAMELDLSDASVLLRADVVEDPRPFYEELRRKAPVWQVPGQDTFLVSDPILIREVVRRPADFSSNLVSILHNDGNGCPVAYAMARFGDPVHVLSTADQPLHTRHRKLLQTHMNPATVAGLAPAVAAFVGESLAPMLDAERVDFVTAFGDVVPTKTVCELIGLPPEDAQWIISTVSAIGALLDGVTELEGMVPAVQAAFDLLMYVQGQVDAALAVSSSQRSGLLAVFADGIETGAIDAGEARDMLLVLVSAGTETTASLLSTAVETLARNPEFQEKLRRDPALIPDAIEDILRTDGPFQFHYRATPHDTELGGTAIPANSRVLLMWAAANLPLEEASGRDLDNSESRGPAPHFAFGKGLHFCIGAPVARLEARIALEQILEQSSSIALVPDAQPTRRPSIFIRRHASLPIVITRA
jgi:cytochrome P450 family 144